MACKNCGSDRLMAVSGKTSDLCATVFKGVGHDQGYVPGDIGMGDNEDYLDFTYCLECGMIQGEFPLPDPSFARKEPE